MKVAVIADVLGEENNGTTIACMNLVRYLRSEGDEVTVVCCDKDKEDMEGYMVVDTYNLGPVINYIVDKNNVSLAKADTKTLVKAIRPVDVVHIMMPFALGKKAAKVAHRLGKPVTAGFHCQAENFTTHICLMNLGLANIITYKNFYNRLYKHVDAVHYPSEFIRDTFESAVHHKTNAYVISNGVNKKFVKRNVQKPKEFNDKIVILFTGRISFEKSHRILVRAVAKSKYKKKIQLIFAGQGPKEGAVKRCAWRHRINMPIMKFFPSDELVDIINYADLYCHPAEIEIEAIACLEAISCGAVPVISDSKRSATKAFAIDDKNLFKCNNSLDLAKKIDYWIEHPEEKEERSREYLSFAKRFDQDECMKQMRNMLLDTIDMKAKKNTR